MSSSGKTQARKLASSPVPRHHDNEFTILNIKRWPRKLDIDLKVEAAKRETTKREILIKAAAHYLMMSK